MGILHIRCNRDLSLAAGLPAPEFDCQGGVVIVGFRPAPGKSHVREAGPTVQVSTQVGAPVSAPVGAPVSAPVAERLLAFCRTPRAPREIRSLLGLKHRSKFRVNHLRPLLAKGWLAMTLPGKPHSRLQRYVTTPGGERWLRESR